MNEVAVITLPKSEWDEVKAQLTTIGAQVAKLTAQEEKELLTPKEVMKILKIGQTTFERYVINGTLEIVRIGSGARQRRYVKRSELDAKIEAGTL